MRVCLPDHTVEECVGGGTCAAYGRSFHAQNDRQAAPTTHIPASGRWREGSSRSREVVGSGPRLIGVATQSLSVRASALKSDNEFEDWLGRRFALEHV